MRCYRHSFCRLEPHQHDGGDGVEVRGQAVWADGGHSRVQAVPAIQRHRVRETDRVRERDGQRQRESHRVRERDAQRQSERTGEWNRDGERKRGTERGIGRKKMKSLTREHWIIGRP